MSSFPSSACTIFKPTTASRVLQEIFRVLKPGSRLINADKYPPDDPSEFSRVLQAHMSLFFDGIRATKHAKLLQTVILHELTDFAPERIMPAQAALQSLSQIGFHNAHFTYRQNFDAVLVTSK